MHRISLSWFLHSHNTYRPCWFLVRCHEGVNVSPTTTPTLRNIFNLRDYFVSPMLLNHSPSRILKPPDSGATNGPTFGKMVDHPKKYRPFQWSTICNGRPFQQMVDHFAKWLTIGRTNWLPFCNGRPFNGRRFSKWSTIGMVGFFTADH